MTLRRRHHQRTLALLAPALIAGLALAACGSASSTSTPARAASPGASTTAPRPGAANLKLTAAETACVKKHRVTLVGADGPDGPSRAGGPPTGGSRTPPSTDSAPAGTAGTPGSAPTHTAPNDTRPPAGSTGATAKMRAALAACGVSTPTQPSSSN